MCSETRIPSAIFGNRRKRPISVLANAVGIILVAWRRFLGSVWCPEDGFWLSFRVLVAVFAIRSLSRARLGAENQVEPSSGTSRAPSGVVWGSPGEVLATNWGSF